MNRRAALFGATAALASPVLLRVLPAAAQPAPASTPGVHRIAVGALEAFVVHDGATTRPDATQGLVANASAEQIRAAATAAGVPVTGMENPFNVTVVRTPRGLVMLDVGRGVAESQMLANMRAAGLNPADVVLIVHTHFHGDHIGGLTDANGQAVFPNVPVLVPEREWAFWNDAGEESRAPANRQPGFANVRRRFAPYQGRVATFAPGAEVAPGIIAVASPGHSPGHSSFLVADRNAQLLVIGDAVNVPAFFVPNPEWVPTFDQEPATAIQSRLRLLDRAATDRIPVVGYHFPMPATGRIERAGSSYRLVPANA
jgi:glyoxylase-like metal-dependent hydrolase (beta-lactamase superfamily II)